MRVKKSNLCLKIRTCSSLVTSKIQCTVIKSILRFSTKTGTFHSIKSNKCTLAKVSKYWLICLQKLDIKEHKLIEWHIILSHCVCIFSMYECIYIKYEYVRFVWTQIKGHFEHMWYHSICQKAMQVCWKYF